MIETLKRSLDSVVLGQEQVIDDMILGLLAGGHILLEGVPGIGKTLLARTLSASLGLGMNRIQFTPDLLPSDVTGSVLYDMKEGEFRVEKGPIFTNIVLADEINRTPPKTQAALLEAMEERQVTLYGTTLPLPAPFFVLATQNPVEYEGTYPLPEAQLDRFLMKIVIQYPDVDAECSMLSSFVPRHLEENEHDRTTVSPVTTLQELLAMQRQVSDVKASPSVIRYIVDIIRVSRSLETVSLGASPRAATAVLMASRAAAFLENRTFITPDDVQRILHPVLAHRIFITPSAELEGVTAHEVVDQLVERVVVPR